MFTSILDWSWKSQLPLCIQDMRYAVIERDGNKYINKQLKKKSSYN